MKRWLLLLLASLLILIPGVYADDDDDEEDDEETIFGIEGEGLGDVALYLMGGSLAIVAWKPTFHWLPNYC